MTSRIILAITCLSTVHTLSCHPSQLTETLGGIKFKFTNTVSSVSLQNGKRGNQGLSLTILDVTGVYEEAELGAGRGGDHPAALLVIPLA